MFGRPNELTKRLRHVIARADRVIEREIRGEDDDTVIVSPRPSQM